MTSLQALAYLDDIAHERKMSLDPHELRQIIEQELEVLKIIKNKKVDTYSLRRLNLEEYNYGVMLGKKNITVYECELLTPEEYNLLKEVLKDD